MNAVQRRVLLFFLKGNWKAYAAISTLGLIVALLEGVHVALLYPLFNELLGSDSSAGGRLARALDGLLALTPFDDKLVAACVLLLAATPLKGVLVVLHERMIGWAAGRVLYGTKKKLLDEYARAPYQFFLDHKLGELQFYALTAPTRAGLILTRLPQLFVELLRVAAIVALLATMSPRATAALLLLGAVVQAVIGWLSHRKSYKLGSDRVESGTRMNALFNELMTGIKPIRVFGSQQWWIERFDVASKRYAEIFVSDAAMLAAPRTIIECVAITALAASLLYMRLNDPSSLAAALPLTGTFAMALMKLLPSLAAINRIRIEVAGSLPDLEGIHRALMVELKRPAEKPGRPFAGLKRSVKLEALRFDYPGRGDILKGVDLEIPAGSSVALVGDSGSGKTTLLNLLLGLYHPTGGSILVDGEPLSGLDAAAWRSRIGLVSQEAFIFNGTIRDNILFGRSHDQGALDRATRLAHADEFISKLPEGWDTLVGERGMKLSGGQQQRVAIARAVLGSPDVLLFDEATSALDNISEAAVQEAISEAGKGRTVIQIAHRLSTIEGADRIFVLHEGRVAESGTHAELLAKNGRYAAFHGLQTR